MHFCIRESLSQHFNVFLCHCSLSPYLCTSLGVVSLSCSLPLFKTPASSHPVLNVCKYNCVYVCRYYFFASVSGRCSCLYMCLSVPIFETNTRTLYRVVSWYLCICMLIHTLHATVSGPVSFSVSTLLFFFNATRTCYSFILCFHASNCASDCASDFASDCASDCASDFAHDCTSDWSFPVYKALNVSEYIY